VNFEAPTTRSVALDDGGEDGHNEAMPVLDAAHLPQPAAISAAHPAEAGGVLTIDLAAIEANWRALARRVTPAECGAVVKGDAYGCGIDPVVRVLSKAGCKTYFVATLAEARCVRALAPESVIYVLDGYFDGSGPAFSETYARPVIGSVGELAEWDAFCASAQWRGGAAIHVDTGMNRLGITIDEVNAVAARLQNENHGFTLLMTHLACAETPDHPLNDRQIQLFREVRRQFRGVPSSMANSSGIYLGAVTHCDLARPGVALYGSNPTPGRENPMRPVIELKGRILQVRNLARGQTVGYGAKWTAKRACRIAIVAVGYADGYLRSASSVDGTSGGQAIVGGQRCPVAGRISMDLMAVDVSDVAGARRGEWATLIGDDLTLDEVAKFCGSIAYELLTRMGRRHHRIYRTE
jgi:alanine racemase